MLATKQDVVFNSYIGSDYSLSVDGRLGCNLGNSPLLATYPTAPTASKGTYLFYDANGSSKLLSAGGTNANTQVTLEVCSSTASPSAVLTANSNGISGRSLSAVNGSVVSQLTPDSLLFGSINYRFVVDTNTSNIATLNNTTIPTINTRLDSANSTSVILNNRLTTNEALTAQHTTQIANLAAVDVTELAKLTDLEAVDVGLKARLNTNETLSALHSTQIATLQSIDVTELAKLVDLDAVDVLLKARLAVIEAKQPIVNSIPIYHVQSVYADSTGRATYIPQTVSAVTPYSGFYYKNDANQKINWYIQPDVGLTVGDLKGLMLNFYNISATTGLGCPFVGVYTKIDSVTPNAASWYKSRKTLSVDYTASTTVNTSYALLANLKSLPYDPIAYGHTKVTATGIPSNDKGPFADAEQILFFSVGTSSNSAAGLFEFIASKFTVLTAKSTQEFAFQQI